MVAVKPAFNIIDFQQGSQEAISQLFQLYYQPLVYFAESITSNRNEAEDIVVDTFIKLMKKTTDFDSLPNIRSFLYVATRNACYNYLQYLKVNNRSQEELGYLATPEIIHPDLAIIDAEVIQAIVEEIENLPPQCKQIFKSYYFKRMNTQEIADFMNLHVKTVRNQKARAISLLQTSLLKRGLLPVTILLHILFFTGE